MKYISLSVLYSLLLLVSLNKAGNSADMAVISGTVQFKCNLLSKYMEKHGYVYLREIKDNKNNKTNLFAAMEAEVYVKNASHVILAAGRTGAKGEFTFTVPKDRYYRIVVLFHDRKVDEIVAHSDIKNYIIDLGHFDSKTVDEWLPEPSLEYCYSCNIRYLENKEANK